MIIDIALFLTGIIVGGLNSIAGGGIVGYPILLAVGLHPLIADATSYVAALPGHITSAWGYRRYLRAVPKFYLWLLVPCAAGAAIGAHLLYATSMLDFEHVVPLLILVIVILSFSQSHIHSHLLDHIKNHQKFNTKFLLIGIICFILMIYGGYFGVGISFSLLVSITLAKSADAHMMNGMKNITAIVVIIVAIASISGTNLIHWHYGLVVGAGSLIGGYFAPRLAISRQLPLRTIHIIALLIGVATVVYLGLRYQ